MSVRDIPSPANRRRAAPDAVRRRLGSYRVAHARALNKQEGDRLDHVPSLSAVREQSLVNSTDSSLDHALLLTPEEAARRLSIGRNNYLRAYGKR
jgi:hypothetical protein